MSGEFLSIIWVIGIPIIYVLWILIISFAFVHENEEDIRDWLEMFLLGIFFSVLWFPIFVGGAILLTYRYTIVSLFKYISKNLKENP